MDCKTARLLLHFAHPCTTELEGSEAESLESHLADCPQCGPLAEAERRMDNRIGQALRAVPVPEGLRNRLLTQLDAERDAWYRRRLLRVAGIVAAAAAVILVVWLAPDWKSRSKVNVESWDEQAWNELVTRPSAQTVEMGFANNGIRTVAPPDFNYDLLTYPLRPGDFQLAEFQGKKVPLLIFAHSKDSQRTQTARVYILSDKEFDWKELDNTRHVVGSGWEAEVKECGSDPHFAYLIIYTAESLQPFIKSDQAP